ncbi:hypothetical protein [Aeoliella mucimassa]|uniref:Uncharacterized protein n=1 Tax=Aeoliella mucimassa TaxID=2527972 RepID=A0A518AR15_9BACT|nr:hypothetical protein [Aeoliella mucimassa]QDU57167.1 hypothetical protein Pan181_33810 [Aeoliella mucimassa]
MAIQVTCPGCLKRFSVGDQHAGKQGPCPNCKKTITIPKLEDQVIVHEAPPEGPVDSQGRSVLKTYRKKDAKFSPIMAGVAVGVVVLAVVAAVLMKSAVQADSLASIAIMAVAAAVLAPPIVAGGYMFLRDDELEPYRGTMLWVRAIACGLGFVVAWLLYGFILSRFTTPEDIVAGLEWWQLLIPLVVMFMVGLLASYTSLDLEPISAIMLFALFFISTGLLRVVMDLPFVPGLVFGSN